LLTKENLLKKKKKNTNHKGSRQIHDEIYISGGINYIDYEKSLNKCMEITTYIIPYESKLN